jgi:hypothetical protein
MTQQCQPGTSVTGQPAAGEGATIDTARNGPAVMAVAGRRKQRSSRQPSSRPLLGQRENPLPRREDDAPVFRSSNGSRTCNGCPRTTRPVALTLRQDRRHLWQVKQATLRFRRNDRVKKGAPCRSISYPFPFPLSLSYNRDRERGYPEKDPSPQRKRAPSPPTDQRFEGWPLGRVQQPPQSTWALRPLLVRGSKTGPSEGFNGRLRLLGLRAHY